MRASCTAALLLTAGLLAGCATTPGNQLAAERDPLEKTNRSIYKFNRGLDKAIVSPATRVYRAAVPVAGQRGIGNAFNNVDEPFSFANALLQGKIKQAFRTAARFLINTTLGVGGLADHATDMGLPEEPEDLGQTLAVWGMKSGPYVMLPLFGPSTVRDAIGFGVERVGDPYRVAVREANLDTVESLGLTGLELADTRSYVMDTADPLLDGSADEYATVKSAYLQYRWNLIHDGAPPDEYEESVPAAAPAVAAATTQPDAAPATAAETAPTTPGEATPAAPDAAAPSPAAEKVPGEATEPPAQATSPGDDAPASEAPAAPADTPPTTPQA